ncbi:adenylate kinase family protein, partial [Acidianus sp. RZ1]|uniref:adenylate kinase family protein n=1 Tax=Acidianus sp. RZ1 TaxID=1540082 RepID=UPI001491798A
MIILVTGTPGVGKTSVAKEIARKLSLEYVHVSEFVLKNNLFSSYDPVRETYEIDDEVVARSLNEYLKTKDAVVESVYPSLLDNADLVIVLRRNPLSLYEELKERGWPELKVAENVEAEAIGYVLQEAMDWFGNACQV